MLINKEIVQTISAQLSWSHNSHFLDKSKNLDEYVWYAQQAIENGWSLSSLEYLSDFAPDEVSRYAALGR